jgi:pimeloyl-ACP methyl ester carboxylesterase
VSPNSTGSGDSGSREEPTTGTDPGQKAVSEATKGAPPHGVPVDPSTDYQVVLLIHGIRTMADWGPMVRSKLEVPSQIEVIPIKYGYFDAFRFWCPSWTRNKPIRRVYTQIRVALQVAREKDPHPKLSIIAHSFGTYITGQILKEGFDLHIHRLILCGSVLPQDFPWEQYQGRFDREKVINECGKTDIWPVLAQSASWGYGASGTHGFGAVLVKDRYHAGGHGQYFEPEFVQESWEPFIRRGEFDGSRYEVEMPPTPWWMSVLGILPLQWISVVLIFCLIVILTLLITKPPGPTDTRGQLPGGIGAHPQELSAVKSEASPTENHSNNSMKTETFDESASENTGGLDELTVKTKNPNYNVRYSAVQSMVLMGPDAKPYIPLLRKLLRTDPSPFVRRAAVEALGRIGPAASVSTPDLTTALKEVDVYLRSMAAKSLGRVDKK